jgi:hypothetical protein
MMSPYLRQCRQRDVTTVLSMNARLDPSSARRTAAGCQQLLNRIGEAAPDDADALAQEQDERAEAKEHRALMTADCHRVPAGFINPDLLRQGSPGV